MSARRAWDGRRVGTVGVGTGVGGPSRLGRRAGAEEYESRGAAHTKGTAHTKYYRVVVDSAEVGDGTAGGTAAG